jgi:hypothetical protein
MAHQPLAGQTAGTLAGLELVLAMPLLYIIRSLAGSLGLTFLAVLLVGVAGIVGIFARYLAVRPMTDKSA